MRLAPTADRRVAAVFQPLVIIRHADAVILVRDRLLGRGIAAAGETAKGNRPKQGRDAAGKRGHRDE